MLLELFYLVIGSLWLYLERDTFKKQAFPITATLPIAFTLAGALLLCKRLIDYLRIF